MLGLTAHSVRSLFLVLGRRRRSDMGRSDVGAAVQRRSRGDHGTAGWHAAERRSFRRTYWL